MPSFCRSGRSAVLAGALALTLAACDWVTLGYSSARTGYNSTESTVSAGNVSALQQTWSAAIGAGPSDQSAATWSPVVGSNRVIVGTQDGVLRAFDKRGNAGCSGSPKICQPLWTAYVGGRPPTYAVHRGWQIFGEPEQPAFPRLSNARRTPSCVPTITRLDPTTGDHVAADWSLGPAPIAALHVCCSADTLPAETVDSVELYPVRAELYPSVTQSQAASVRASAPASTAERPDRQKLGMSPLALRSFRELRASYNAYPSRAHGHRRRRRFVAVWSTRRL